MGLDCPPDNVGTPLILAVFSLASKNPPPTPKRRAQTKSTIAIAVIFFKFSPPFRDEKDGSLFKLH